MCVRWPERVTIGITPSGGTVTASSRSGKEAFRGIRNDFPFGGSVRGGRRHGGPLRRGGRLPAWSEGGADAGASHAGRQRFQRNPHVDLRRTWRKQSGNRHSGRNHAGKPLSQSRSEFPYLGRDSAGVGPAGRKPHSAAQLHLYFLRNVRKPHRLRHRLADDHPDLAEGGSKAVCGLFRRQRACAPFRGEIPGGPGSPIRV